MQNSKRNKNTYKGIWYIITICFLYFSTNAQSPFFHIQELTSSVKQSSFNTIFEDKSGRIYLGTTTGLLFFDGQKMHKVSVLNDSILSVTAIYQTSAGQLLVGCANGSIYHLEQGQLIPFDPVEGNPKARITGFQEDTSGRLWLATYGEGVYFFDKNRMYNIDEEDGLLGNDIYVIERGGNNQMWFGTDGGISGCSFENEVKKIRNITKKNGLPDDIVHALQSDQHGNMWIGMYDHGVCRLNVETGTIDFAMKNWEHGIVNTIELFEGEELWIGTNGEGVFRYLIQEELLVTVNDNIDFSDSKIKDLLRDVEGNIWVLDNIHKLSSANKQFERLYVPMNNIQSILIDESRKMWMGTENGLYCWNQTSSVIQGADHKPLIKERLSKEKLNVTCLFQDEYDNLWIGTFGKGVYLYHEETKALRRFSEKDGLTNNSVLSIDGVDGHIWLATLGGVTEVTIKRNPISAGKIVPIGLNGSYELGTNFIYKVFVDSKKRVWFGTDGKGLSILENGKIKNFKEVFVHTNDDSEPITLKTIYAITEDLEGHIWLSTSKQGVFKFDGESFHKLRLKEDLNHVTVTSLTSNQQGDVLLIYPGGVAILDPLSDHLIYYDYEVGLKDIDPNLNVITRDDYGNIWFSDQNILVKYVSLQEKLEIHPRTILSELFVNYEPIEFSQTEDFEPNQNNFVFRYTGLWYTAPEKVKYKYRLNGYDQNWIYSKDSQVSYSSLPPGDFSFEVTSTENDAFHDEPISRFSFHIAKPLWQRTWFLLLASLLIIASVYIFIKARDRRKQRVNELQKEKLSSQLAAIKAQINPHFLFNSFNTLATLIEENQEAAVEYVERLSDFYRSMLQYRDVEIISIKEEAELVKNFAFLLKKRFGDNFKITVNINGTTAYLAPLSLQTLVENAVKHNVISKSKPLAVNIEIENNNYVSVSNNVQKKLTSEQSTGFGLQSLKRRYELLSNQKIKIEKSEKHFKIYLPLIK